MFLKGVLAEIMVMIDPKLYRKYVDYNIRGDDILCV